jgi:hypothetical protein
MAVSSTFLNIKASLSTPAELAAESVEGMNGQPHWDSRLHCSMVFIHLHNDHVDLHNGHVDLHKDHMDLHNGHVNFAKWFWRLSVA